MHVSKDSSTEKGGGKKKSVVIPAHTAHKGFTQSGSKNEKEEVFKKKSFFSFKTCVLKVESFLFI